MQFDVIRAWKDADYRDELAVSDQALAANPVGFAELSDTDLGLVGGALGGSASARAKDCGVTNDIACFVSRELNGSCRIGNTYGCCC
jgi:mersacidin/lichenicidin family type 2 lantibiotic